MIQRTALCHDGHLNGEAIERSALRYRQTIDIDRVCCELDAKLVRGTRVRNRWGSQYARVVGSQGFRRGRWLGNFCARACSDVLLSLHAIDGDLSLGAAEEGGEENEKECADGHSGESEEREESSLSLRTAIM